MANSYVQYSGNGAQTQFSLTFPYLSTSDIGVKVNGVTTTFTWVNSTTLSVSPAPVNGSVVELRRTTPSSSPTVNFQNGAIVTEDQLNTNALQSLYVAQEDQDVSAVVLASAGADQAAAAATSATAAAASATSASTQATAAATSATASATSAASAATALAAAWKKDGSVAATGDMPLGTHKLTGVGDPTSAQDAATKAYVDASVSGGFETGDFVISTRSSKSAGWLKMDDGTIGDASSSATSRANADTSALFTHLWNTYSNSLCPVSTGRGVSAAADFAAHKTIGLTVVLGRALVVAGTGSGLTARTLGSTFGAETVTLGVGEVPNLNVSVTGTVSGIYTSASDTGTNHEIGKSNAANPDTVAVTATGATTNGGGGAHANMQPSAAVNVFIRL